MSEVNKRTITQEVTEYFWDCPRCGEEGTSKYSWSVGNLCATCKHERSHFITKSWDNDKENIVLGSKIEGFETGESEYEFNKLFIRLTNGMLLTIRSASDEYDWLDGYIEDTGEAWK